MAILASANTTAVIGFVQKVDGNVKVKTQNSFKKQKIKSGYEIKSGDLITTAKRSNVVLKLVDQSVLVLDPNSSIHFKSDNNAEQTEGKVFYKITSRDAKNSLKIKTPFAIIGIKGTTFIVNADENEASVKLQEGLIGIESLKEDFKLFRKEQEKKFDDFQKEQQAGFDKFKQEHKKSIAEVTKAFDLHAGDTVSFLDDTVSEKEFSKDDEEEFLRFKELMSIKP